MSKQSKGGPAGNLPDSHRKFTDVIGYEATMKLIDAYSGEYLYIPKRDALEKAERNQRIFHDYQNGVPVKQLKRKYNMSVVSIYEIINKALGKK